MLRYYALATVLVIAGLLAAFLDAPRSRAEPGPADPGAVPSAAASGSPSPPRLQGTAPAPLPDEWIARAPWALSALPECFEQLSVARGGVAFVRGNLPRGFRAVAAGTELASADCRVRVYRRSAIVQRGESVLFIPPLARVFVRGARVALLEELAGRGQLRVYRAAGGLRSSLAGAPFDCAALARNCLRPPHP